MEQDITLKEEVSKLAFFKPIAIAFKGKFEKQKLYASFKKTGITIISILLFLCLWHFGSKALYNKEATYRIEKALTEQGQEAATAVKACIASGESSCQPNTLPSPAQVWGSLQSLIADHKLIQAKKDAFAEKMAATNANLIAQGKEAIVYTGRASFIDTVLTSLLTVFA
ncbi:MAG: ABC transporter permease, partial [Flavobacterium sp.]|nr:ABC transporter permease [Flavobacterium sp.]